jgi:hypothetical protein
MRSETTRRQVLPVTVSTRPPPAVREADRHYQATFRVSYLLRTWLHPHLARAAPAAPFNPSPVLQLQCTTKIEGCGTVWKVLWKEPTSPKWHVANTFCHVECALEASASECRVFPTVIHEVNLQANQIDLFSSQVNRVRTRATFLYGITVPRPL